MDCQLGFLNLLECLCQAFHLPPSWYKVPTRITWEILKKLKVKVFIILWQMNYIIYATVQIFYMSNCHTRSTRYSLTRWRREKGYWLWQPAFTCSHELPTKRSPTNWPVALIFQPYHKLDTWKLRGHHQKRKAIMDLVNCCSESTHSWINVTSSALKGYALRSTIFSLHNSQQTKKIK